MSVSYDACCQQHNAMLEGREDGGSAWLGGSGEERPETVAEVVERPLLVSSERSSQPLVPGGDLVDDGGLGGWSRAPFDETLAEIAICANFGAADAARLGEVTLDAALLAGPAGPFDDSDTVGDHDDVCCGILLEL